MYFMFVKWEWEMLSSTPIILFPREGVGIDEGNWERSKMSKMSLMNKKYELYYNGAWVIL